MSQPLYLFADSQPLFWRGGAFLAGLCQAAGNSQPNVAYIGASNGDSPDAHGIFAAAFEQIDTRRTHWVRADYSAADRGFLETADVIVLAGGDVEAGWNVFTRTGMRELIEKRYREGAILVGVSAGAVQFGKYAAVPDAHGGQKLLETFGLIDFLVDVHDEKRDWQGLSATIQLLEGTRPRAGHSPRRRPHCPCRWNLRAGRPGRGGVCVDGRPPAPLGVAGAAADCARGAELSRWGQVEQFGRSAASRRSC